MSSTKSNPTSTATDLENSAASMWQKLEAFIANDQLRADFMKELIYRYEYLSEQYQQGYVQAQQRDAEAVRTWQREKLAFEEHITTLRICLERDPFVIVLIDGDGMIFEDELIKLGDAGGHRAASLLYNAILSYVQRETINIPTDVKVVCRVYANVQGLADVLCRTGVASNSDTVVQFTRGFTRGKTLFDFVDVGPGKDRADEKIIETYKLYLNDFHCRQIFFGCSHDNGYARTLEDTADDVCRQRVTLIEGVPFEKELLALPFNTRKFPGIFRSTKINALGSQPANGVAKNYNILNGLPSRFPPPRQNGLLDSPVQTNVSPNIPRTPSASTLASNDGLTLAKPVLNSWAAKAAAPAPPATESASPVYKPVSREDVVARNRQGQRVDPQCRDYDKVEVDRIKKMKMCNVHFLRQECPYGDNCSHAHSYKPSRDEANTLRLVARMAPCIHGSGCTDVKCIYGHRCPAPPSKNPVKGTKTCIFGEQCKFPPELHEIDCNVVKTLLPGCVADLIGLQL